MLCKWIDTDMENVIWVDEIEPGDDTAGGVELPDAVVEAYWTARAAYDDATEALVRAYNTAKRGAK